MSNKAISLGMGALIVIALIFLAGFGLFLNDKLNATNTTSINQTLLTVPTLITNVGSADSSSYNSSQTAITPTTTSSTSAYCIISAAPTGFYLHVVGDYSDAPIAGAKLTTTPVSECDNSNTTLTDSRESFATNSSGWIYVAMSSTPSGNFFLVFNIHYSNSTFTFSKTFNVYWEPERAVSLR